METYLYEKENLEERAKEAREEQARRAHYAAIDNGSCIPAESLAVKLLADIFYYLGPDHHAKTREV